MDVRMPKWNLRKIHKSLPKFVNFYVYEMLIVTKHQLILIHQLILFYAIDFVAQFCDAIVCEAFNPR